MIYYELWPSEQVIEVVTLINYIYVNYSFFRLPPSKLPYMKNTGGT